MKIHFFSEITQFFKSKIRKNSGHMPNYSIRACIMDGKVKLMTGGRMKLGISEWLSLS
jgi:hypothetical protein